MAAEDELNEHEREYEALADRLNDEAVGSGLLKLKLAEVESQLSYLLRAYLVTLLENPDEKSLAGAFDALFGRDPRQIAKVLDGLADAPLGPGSAVVEMAKEQGDFDGRP